VVERNTSNGHAVVTGAAFVLAGGAHLLGGLQVLNVSSLAHIQVAESVRVILAWRSETALMNTNISLPNPCIHPVITRVRFHTLPKAVTLFADNVRHV